LCIKEAQKSNFSFVEGSQFKTGCVVLKNGKVIGKGYNKKVTPNKLLQNYGYKYVHAEADALLDSNLKGDTIIVIRLLKNGNMSMSMPCKRCSYFIKKHGIKKVYYSDWFGKIQTMSI